MKLAKGLSIFSACSIVSDVLELGVKPNSLQKLTINFIAVLAIPTSGR
jgi:hypothetical protein